MLRYAPDALLVIGGPSGAGKSTLAARVLAAPPLDADDIRASIAAERGVSVADVPWPVALARTRAGYVRRLGAGEGAVVVATAVRRGHRLGLAKDAAAAGVPCHLLMLDATLEQCRAGRTAQGEERISEGLFVHLVREWAAFRRELAADGPRDGVASVTVLDRQAADALERIERS